MKLLLSTLVLLTLSVGPSISKPLSFDGQWKNQGFLSLWSNKYVQQGDTLQVSSDGTVSMLYTPVSSDYFSAQKASWNWKVSKTVTPTDLTIKGGDDRNLAVYFVFANQDTADKIKNISVRKLFKSKDVKSLVYVWGGQHDQGEFLDSPYGNGSLATVIKRPATVGNFKESVNLKSDFRKAFGTDFEALVGVAISADSDDTNGLILAEISNLEMN